MKNITKECDCEKNPKGIIAEDQGSLASLDGVAIDQAAYDIIVKHAGEVFEEYNHKKGTAQIIAAEECGMGKKEYTLKQCA